MSVSQNINIAYSLNQPLSAIFPSPIVSLRSPLSTDKAQIGTVWVNKTLNDAWVLTSIVSNSATWLGIGGGAGEFSDLTITGDADIGTAAGSAIVIGNDQGATSVTLNSGTGDINLATNTGGDINISADDVLFVGGTLVNISSTPTISFATDTGAATVNVATGGTGVKTVNIATGAAANVTTIGTTTAASTLTLKTPTGAPVTSANGLTATVGNLTATNGNVVLSTAATYVQLPGPVKIMTGAGVPSNGLAVNVGDMYINTTAATLTTRIYIATGAGAWTNIVCAA